MKEMVLVGVDVSKMSLDIFIKPAGTSMAISNDLKGYKQWWKEMDKLLTLQTNVMVVMEHTGLYSLQLEHFLRKSGVGYCKIPALEIKRSLGVIRGKNDKIDAERIATYGWLRRETLTPDPLMDPSNDELKNMLSLRFKLVRDRAGYVSRMKEMKAAGCIAFMEVQQRMVAMFTKEILFTEQEIKAHIEAHPELKKTCELLCSIKGVGLIIAAYMIANTGNFKRFSNARKFNCYAGIAPFNYQSGTSVKSKSRVSHLAKSTKSLLHLAATCAIRCDEDLKAYYQRRVGEGKNKMSCINMVRAKLVARMFAVIKRQTPYQPLAAAA